jgi:hypothetical protein
LKPLEAEVLADTGLTPAAAIGSGDAVARQQRLYRRQHGVAILGLWRDPDVHGAAA